MKKKSKNFRKKLESIKPFSSFKLVYLIGGIFVTFLIFSAGSLYGKYLSDIQYKMEIEEYSTQKSLSSETTGFSPYDSLTRESIVKLTNAYRKQAGLKDYTVSEKLQQAAQKKADHMVLKGYFEHTSPEGVTGWSFLEDSEYVYTLAGENLASTNQGGFSVVTGWYNSEGHRINLLSSSYDEVGIGISFKGDYLTYSNVTFIVAMYGKEYPN
jgi:uncharacterized protein YkwD